MINVSRARNMQLYDRRRNIIIIYTSLSMILNTIDLKDYNNMWLGVTQRVHSAEETH